ncbi:histidinol-phosphatase [Paenibacillus segetis]|uniref:Histidinol-phosphatase n=1 Tax=Paenibacillus segetis TaxID=1325360 RepID=A0ABQ1Y216_9BACL|nr:histidinol-phosphatase [Paenibacillus segetis]GGH09178.1 putative histidinol-phosphatase [Paenibacillus segetis]
MMKFDFHTHHERCGHATGTLREYVIAAVESNLQIIGLADHLPLFAEQTNHPSPGECMAKSEFPNYVNEVLQLKHEFAGKIDVLLGAEADFIPNCLGLYREIIGSYPFDYVIGSVHEFAGNSLYNAEYWEQLTTQGKLDYKNSYYYHVARSAKCGLYDILGHVDALDRYLSGYKEYQTEVADETLRTIAENDIVIEINSSDEHWVPNGVLLERAFHYGVKVTFGSDAHEPERVGDHFEGVRQHLLEIGYREWAIFNKRQRMMIPL